MAKFSERKTPEAISRKAALDAIPTNWLDDLLTGPKAVLPGAGATWGCPEIEALLNALRARIAALPTIEQK